MGAVTDSYEYDAYGNSFTVSGTTPNEMMYRGEQYDSDLGLYYLRVVCPIFCTSSIVSVARRVC